MIEDSNDKVNCNENISIQNLNNHQKVIKNDDIPNGHAIKMGMRSAKETHRIILWLKNNPDLKSILLLIALYIIQGLPFGLSTAIPVILDIFLCQRQKFLEV